MRCQGRQKDRSLKEVNIWHGFLLCFAGLVGSSSRTAPEPLQQVPPRHWASASWSGVALVQFFILSSTLRAGDAECYLKVGGFFFIFYFFARGWKWLAVALSAEIPVPPKLGLLWGRISPNVLTGLVGAKLFLLERANSC